MCLQACLCEDEGTERHKSKCGNPNNLLRERSLCLNPPLVVTEELPPHGPEVAPSVTRWERFSRSPFSLRV